MSEYEYLTNRVFDRTQSILLKEAIDSDELSIVKRDNTFWLECRGAEDAVQKIAINETKDIFPDLIYLGDITGKGVTAMNNTAETREDVVENELRDYGSDKHYDALVNSDNWQDRLFAAKEGYALYLLINDDDSLVRATVANHGVGLDKLIYDNDPIVRAEVVAALIYNDKAIQTFVASADDIAKDKALSVISSYKDGIYANTAFMRYSDIYNQLQKLTQIKETFDFINEKEVQAHNFDANEDNKRIYGDNYSSEYHTRFSTPIENAERAVDTMISKYKFIYDELVTGDNIERALAETSFWLDNYDTKIKETLKTANISENDMVVAFDNCKQDFDKTAVEIYNSAVTQIYTSIKEPSKFSSRSDLNNEENKTVPFIAKSFFKVIADDERASLRESMIETKNVCDAIDEAINSNYDYPIFHYDKAIEALPNDKERVEYVLAVHIADRDWDARFDKSNVNWANSVLSKYDAEFNEQCKQRICLTSHSTLINSLASEYIKLQKEREPVTSNKSVKKQEGRE